MESTKIGTSLKGTGASAVSELENSGPRPVTRLIELVILCVAFYIVCRLLAVDTTEALFRQMAMYSAVVMLSIILSQKWFGAYKSISEVSRYILADAVGILAGTCAVLMLQSFVAASVEFSMAVVLSSVVSFFVLGTITSLVRSPRSQKKQGQILKSQ